MEIIKYIVIKCVPTTQRWGEESGSIICFFHEQVKKNSVIWRQCDKLEMDMVNSGAKFLWKKRGVVNNSLMEIEL